MEIPARPKGQEVRPFMHKKVVSKMLRVCDGDTFYVNIYDLPPLLGQNIGVRVRGIDAPELKSKDSSVSEQAKVAREATLKILLAAKTIVLHNITRGKYFRLIADVEVDGVDLATTLLDKKLVKIY